MAEIRAYLFTDSEGPNVKYIDSEYRAKLEAYLSLLKSYYSTISDGTTNLQVDNLKYKLF